MGFAQKLGEFTEGFAGGLLPGLKVGSRIGADRSRRAIAVKREQRLAGANERSMIYSMAKESPSDAIRLAESLGFTDIATAIRSGAQREARTSIAKAGGALPTGPVAAPTDYSIEGLREQTKALGARIGQQATGIAELRGAAAGIPKGIMSPEAMEGISTGIAGEVQELEGLHAQVASVSTLLSGLQGLNLMAPDIEEQLNDIADIYAKAIGATPMQVRAYKRSILDSSKEMVIKAWKPAIDAADHTRLLEIFDKVPVVHAYPELSGYLNAKIGVTRRLEARDVSDVERLNIAQNSKEITFLENQAELIAPDDPEAAQVTLERVATIMSEPIMRFSAESIEVYRNNIRSSVNKWASADWKSTYDKVVMQLLDPVQARFLGMAVGIEIDPKEWKKIKISDPSFKNIARLITNTIRKEGTNVGSGGNAIIGGGPGTINPTGADDSLSDESTVDKIVQILNTGTAEAIGAAVDLFIENITVDDRARFIPLFRAKQWQWVPSDKGGNFERYTPPTTPPTSQARDQGALMAQAAAGNAPQPAQVESTRGGGTSNFPWEPT